MDLRKESSMPFLIRPARLKDLPALARVYDAAKAYMRLSGNPHQWRGAYPDPQTLAEDIRRGHLYTMEAEGEIHGVFALIPGEEITYRRIEGAWRNDAPYATIHRVASDGAFPGVFRACAGFAKARHDNLRVDTHADNAPMQRAITENGFRCCGVIHLLNGDPRLAYQYVKDT